jgi:peptidyl-tRNA hydrolase
MGTKEMIKAYYVFRKDLNMSPAKLAVQCGHGTQLLMLSVNYKVLEDWRLNSDSRKIICEISSEEKLHNLYDALPEYIDKEEIWDSGYTEFNGKTLTGIAFIINDKYTQQEVLKKVKRLQLYKG